MNENYPDLDSKYTARLSDFWEGWDTALLYYIRSRKVSTFREDLREEFNLLSIERQKEIKYAQSECKRFARSCRLFQQHGLRMPRDEKYTNSEIVDEANAVLSGQQLAFVISESLWKARYGVPPLQRGAA